MEEIIHYMDPQSRAIRTHRILEVFEIPHRDVMVEIRKGGQNEPGYDEIHPYRRVPALRHGDLTIVESGAITLYLADLFPEKMNTPKPGTPARARFYEWLFFFQTTLEPLVMESFDPTKKEAAIPKIRKLLESMACKFVGPYLLGNDFSVADVVAHTELSWYQMMGIFPDGLEPYQGFMERMKDHVKAAV